MDRSWQNHKSKVLPRFLQCRFICIHVTQTDCGRFDCAPFELHTCMCIQYMTLITAHPETTKTICPIFKNPTERWAKQAQRFVCTDLKSQRRTDAGGTFCSC